MIGLLEDKRTEFKVKITDGIEKEVIAFLNTDGGNIFIGVDDKGNIQVYASIYDPENPNSKLESIETEKEWKVIETILETLQEEIKKKQDTTNNEQ